MRRRGADKIVNIFVAVRAQRRGAVEVPATRRPAQRQDRARQQEWYSVQDHEVHPALRRGPEILRRLPAGARD